MAVPVQVQFHQSRPGPAPRPRHSREPTLHACAMGMPGWAAAQRLAAAAAHLGRLGSHAPPARRRRRRDGLGRGRCPMCRRDCRCSNRSSSARRPRLSGEQSDTDSERACGLGRQPCPSQSSSWAAGPGAMPKPRTRRLPSAREPQPWSSHSASQSPCAPPAPPRSHTHARARAHTLREICVCSQTWPHAFPG